MVRPAQRNDFDCGYGYFKKLLESKYRFYRLFFNLIAILTLIPVALFTYSIRTEAIFQWNGYLRIGQVILLGLAVLLFIRGGRHYGIRQVLGIKQIREGTSDMAITDTGELDTSGVLGMTRHPWYLATGLLIWARQMDVSAIIRKCDTYILLNCRNLPRGKKTCA